MLASGPPFDCVGRRATVRLPLDTGPLRSGRTDQVSPCCGVQLLFPKQWGMLIFGRDLPNSPGRGSRTPQRPALRLRGKTRYRAPSTRHRATPLRANGSGEPLLRCATAISQAMGYVDLWARLTQAGVPHSPAAHPSTAWEDALPCAFHSTQGHSAQDERMQVSALLRCATAIFISMTGGMRE